MRDDAAFAIPRAFFHGAQLARVVSVQDRDNLGRVQVRLLGPDADNEAPIWARVAVPFAGPSRGAFLIPDKDDEVLVMFVSGERRSAVVIGGLWNGDQQPPESLSGEHVDRWTFTGTNGTRIAIIEQSQGQEQIILETPTSVTATFTDQGGGKVEIKAGQNTITLDTSGITVKASAKVTVQGTDVTVTAGSVKVNSVMSTFSGTVKCAALITEAVNSKAYTPGIGNVW